MVDFKGGSVCQNCHPARCFHLCALSSFLQRSSRDSGRTRYIRRLCNPEPMGWPLRTAEAL